MLVQLIIVLLTVLPADAPNAATSQSRPATEATATGSPAPTPTPAPLALDRVELTCSAFNPSLGQMCGVRFQLNREALVTVQVYGPNREEIARPAKAQKFAAGWGEVMWNGLDQDGVVVPDEAYFFTVVATAGEEGVVVDPLLTSGGERIIATKLRTFEDAARLSYHLPRACRVLVRAAVVNGPLLRTIVNWRPRTAGLVLESWDGRDADGLRHILDIPNAKIAVMAFALPDLTVITSGNDAILYREYYTGIAGKRPHKPPVVRAPLAEGVLSPHALLPAHLNRDPDITLTVPEIDKVAERATPADKPAASPAPEADRAKNDDAATADTAKSAAEDRITTLERSPVLLRVDIPDALDLAFMNNQRFELIIYVDDQRMLEVEQGHVPFTYPWDTTALTPGRHLVTVNVASFRNHIGTASRWVDIKR